ncbi:MAG: hypothetical protein II056_04285, partial [Paludibacteraceae bacterium]|nr:hypothetical protein [Paludibacteraceae bacterium]
MFTLGRKVIKKFLTIITVLAVIILSLPLIITLLLSNRGIQNYVVDQAAAEAGKFLGTEVSIGNIEYRMPASISLHDVYLED